MAHLARAASTQTVAAQRNVPANVRVIVDRRALVGGSTALCLSALLPREAYAAPASMEIKPVSSAASAYLKRRDEDAAWKCSGGMFDCDGNREEFAKRQWDEFLARGMKASKQPTKPRS